MFLPVATGIPEKRTNSAWLLLMLTIAVNAGDIDFFNCVKLEQSGFLFF